MRSERLFCEQLGYHLLWLWLLDRELSQRSFDHSVCAKDYERGIEKIFGHGKRTLGYWRARCSVGWARNRLELDFQCVAWNLKRWVSVSAAHTARLGTGRTLVQSWHG